MNALNWFEIPVVDFERAARFYETVLAQPLRRDNDFPGMRLAILPYSEPGVGGALLWREDAQQTGMLPAQGGVKVYLNAGDDLQPVLARVVPAGGKVVMPRMQVSPEIGYIAFFEDSEGNVVGLHSPH